MYDGGDSTRLWDPDQRQVYSVSCSIITNISILMTIVRNVDEWVGKIVRYFFYDWLMESASGMPALQNPSRYFCLKMETNAMITGGGIASLSGTRMRKNGCPLLPILHLLTLCLISAGWLNTFDVWQSRINVSWRGLNVTGEASIKGSRVWALVTVWCLALS